jgi:hypothetical protein
MVNTLPMQIKIRIRGPPPVHPIESQRIETRLASQILQDVIQAMRQVNTIQLRRVVEVRVRGTVEVVEVCVLPDE